MNHPLSFSILYGDGARMYNFGYAMGGIRDGLASAAVIDAADAWFCAEKVTRLYEHGADVWSAAGTMCGGGCERGAGERGWSWDVNRQTECVIARLDQKTDPKSIPHMSNMPALNDECSLHKIATSSALARP